jgi:hypothetical protein
VWLFAGQTKEIGYSQFDLKHFISRQYLLFLQKNKYENNHVAGFMFND